MNLCPHARQPNNQNDIAHILHVRKKVVWICFEDHKDEDGNKGVCSFILMQMTEETLA